MNKKGVELTLTTIVVAALLLIVLAVVVFIFFGESNDFRKEINSCNAPASCQKPCDNGSVPIGTNCTLDGGATDGLCCRALG